MKLIIWKILSKKQRKFSHFTIQLINLSNIAISLSYSLH